MQRKAVTPSAANRLICVVIDLGKLVMSWIVVIHLLAYLSYRPIAASL
jgi:hypothetical protein